ncbi:MAG: CDP-diacylglycerol--glycerol-3-phosphate 3-phosphatidyltransferase [Verrucomicrobiota bacterium]|nr:CDP-diacylglycerol--glycerol-3-phosphate 3-phosphatidyltransferase [Verrucomicrobiota bacterium]
MNLPNKLTVSRFFLTALFTALMLSEQPWTYTLSLLVFIVVMVTDYLDGAIARKRNLRTNFGVLMDPLADKVFNCAAFVCFLAIDHHIMGGFGPWAVVVIISREFLITGLRLLATSQNVILPADSLGKHKTVWQMITITVILIGLSLKELIFGQKIFFKMAYGYREWMMDLVLWCTHATLAITVALTIYSGTSYLIKNRNLLRE